MVGIHLQSLDLESHPFHKLRQLSGHYFAVARGQLRIVQDSAYACAQIESYSRYGLFIDSHIYKESAFSSGECIY